MPSHELDRLAQLRSLGLLPHTEPSSALDALVEIAAEVCGTSIALVTLLEEHEQHFKAQRGIERTGTPRDISFCTHAIEGTEIYEVCDASKNPLFADNPLVVEDHVRFYAGAPMTLTSGYRIGTVCVLDDHPRKLTEHQRLVLKSLATACVSLFEEDAAQRQQELWFRRTLDGISDAVVAVDTNGLITSMNRSAEPLLAQIGDAAVGSRLADSFQVFDLEGNRITPIINCLTGAERQSAGDGELLAMADGERHEIEYSVDPIVDEESVVSGAVMVMRDVSRERDLERRALIDGLTGAHTRYAFETVMTAHLAAEGPPGGAVMFFDLDRFKAVNDSLGHAAGDGLLRAMCLRVGALVGPFDVLARVGGDEFAILMPTAGPLEVEQLADLLIAEVDQFCSTFNDARADVSASIGAAMLDEVALTFGEVLRRADLGCYRSKRGGGGRLSVFSHAGELADIPSGNAGWLSIVETALLSTGLQLFGQRIRHDGGRSDSLEVLLRLRHDGRIITAAEFLTPVERTLLASKIDLWVVKATLEQLAVDSRALNSFGLVHINLSARTIGDRPTANQIVRLVRESGVPSDKLCFEITETMAITDIVAVQDFVTAVQSLGCRFAVDDFGRGFASFEHLMLLPLDILKIDRMFISNLATDPLSRHLVAAVRGVCQHLGVDIIAEGVEEIETVDVLINLGIGSCQGYLYHRPEPLDHLLDIEFRGTSPVAEMPLAPTALLAG